MMKSMESESITLEEGFTMDLGSKTKEKAKAV
jgi:hypothetical protein